MFYYVSRAFCCSSGRRDRKFWGENSPIWVGLSSFASGRDAARMGVSSPAPSKDLRKNAI